MNPRDEPEDPGSKPRADRPREGLRDQPQVTPADQPEADAIHGFDAALDSIDRATLALNLSQEVAPGREQLAQVRVACVEFAAAIGELDALPAGERERPDWSEWRAEAVRGLEAARQRMSRETSRGGHGG